MSLLPVPPTAFLPADMATDLPAQPNKGREGADAPPPATSGGAAARGGAPGNAFFSDRVEISAEVTSSTLSTSSDIQLDDSGSYRLSQAATVRHMTAQFLSSRQMEQAEAGSPFVARLDTAALLGQVTDNLRAGFGAGSQAAGDWADLTAMLENADPAMARGLMLLMTVLSREDAEAASSMIRNLKSFFSAHTRTPELNLRQLPAGPAPQGGNGNPPPVMVERTMVFSATIKGSVTSATTDLQDAIREAGGGDVAAEDMAVSVEGGVMKLEVKVKVRAALQDPLVLDLDGDGIDLKSADEGVAFDITGDGRKEQTAFVQGDDALLYMDQNGNGLADNGRELFGDQEGDAHGFAELAKHDSNRDGVIDRNDAAYTRLRLWQDLNGDGVNQRQESRTLEEAGVDSISVDHDYDGREDGSGNRIAETGRFTRTDGSVGLMADAMLRYYA